MGSSYVEFREQGFWSRDATVEIWMFLLSVQARRRRPLPAWLKAAAQDWEQQATTGLHGSLWLGLDRVAPHPKRAAILLGVVEHALADLRGRQGPLSAEWLNRLGLGGPGAMFTGDLPIAALTPFGEALAKLLRGEWVGSAGADTYVL